MVTIIIRNGMVHDAVKETPYLADLALRDGKIAAIGKDLTPLAGEEVFDASGLQVYPGLVESHSHVGCNPYGLDPNSNDITEKGAIGAEYNAIDSFNPQNTKLRDALCGGVTTICTGPGSGNVIDGTAIAVKTYGSSIDEMLVKSPVAMKCAFGQNPKNTAKKPVTTRMGVAAVLRQALYDTRDYMMRKEAAGDDVLKKPKYDPKLEALIPVLKREIPLKAHCHRADDICTAIRIAKEFDLRMTLEHATDGIAVVKEIARSGFPCTVGPSLTHASKVELAHKSTETAGVLHRAGVKVSITTDAAVTHQELLALAAGQCVKAGMDPFAALQAITINAAEHIGIAHRVGSLEVGKDADVVITDGDILLNTTKVKCVFVYGKKVVG